MVKNHELRVKIDIEQLAKAKRKAKSLGMSVSDYVRLLLTTAKPIIDSE